MFTIAASERGFIRKLRRVHLLLIIVMAAVILMVLAGNTVIIRQLSSDSMSPSLVSGSWIVFAKQELFTSKLQKGDVVLLTTSEKNVQLVQRVEGLPGETISWESQKIHLENDQYFVVGDNREVSIDSRDFGPISRSQILGVALFPKTTQVIFP